jgi:Carboxypeptidase regulatory-like domain
MLRTRITVVFALLLLLSGGSHSPAQQQQPEASDPSLWIEVRDERGMPLKDACVTVVPREGDILFRKADQKGRVRIRKLTRGHYRVTAKVDGYAAQKKEFEMGTSAETVSFSLQPRNQ